MSKAPVTEIYVVVTVSGELDGDGIRERIANMLAWAAEEIERPGYRGGVVGSEDSPVDEIEIMVVDSIEAARRELPEGVRWDDDEAAGEA